MEMLAAVRRALQRAGQLPEVRIALHPSLGAAQLPRLQGIASKLGAEVLPDAGARTPPPPFPHQSARIHACKHMHANTRARIARDKHVRSSSLVAMRGLYAFVRPACMHGLMQKDHMPPLIHPRSASNHHWSSDMVGRVVISTTAAAAGAAGCTHVVFPFGPEGDPDDGQNYMRSLEARGASVRVHWWCAPAPFNHAPPPPPPHVGFWCAVKLAVGKMIFPPPYLCVLGASDTIKDLTFSIQRAAEMPSLRQQCRPVTLISRTALQ